MGVDLSVNLAGLFSPICHRNFSLSEPRAGQWGEQLRVIEGRILLWSVPFSVMYPA